MPLLISSNIHFTYFASGLGTISNGFLLGYRFAFNKPEIYNLAWPELWEDLTHRNFYNQGFLKEELNKYDLYFNDIEGRKLDLQQRTAIITDEDNNIVIAGAGSAKTTTIVGKVTYVIDRYKIPADQILLISFTKKSALELSKRIPIADIEAKTFHKFGKDVITETEQIQPSLFDENQYGTLINGVIYSVFERFKF